MLRAALMVRILVVMLALLLAACQPLPHPFAKNLPPPDAPILALTDNAGVTVAPVTGVPPAAQAALAEAMAEALQESEILATTQGRNRGSYSLVGAAAPVTGSTVTIDWRLLDPAGQPVGEVAGSAQVAPDALDRGDQAALKRVAAAAAPALAKLMQGDAPQPAPAAAASDAPETDLHHVAVRPVTGAPGDGREALTRAMAQALARAQVAVLPGDGGGKALAVVGTVTMAPPQGGQQKVKITWTLVEPDGKQLGVVKQENAIPAGSLDRQWGDVAFAVAEAAAPGILALIAKAEQVRMGS